MKLMKTSVIACALSALLVGPVLAQGASSDTKLRGGQGKTMQAPGSDDEDLSAQPPGAAGEKTGMKSTTKGTKGTVGTTGSAPHKGTADDAATGGTSKRY
ncbi:hypothetical protein IVB18_43410 [Bradyrhizobium sp. 186]|uniref:hypothetical protein n=1 Tax=Bradyrhizobium sp. 186 TaxID=2782654 RepID=UPI0020019C21|nr:hypothetical protein [Bradyrhizobium sp. 186]UPK34778.1 hypothetical protein IVB18_43410 [Bradyrhizobium sp. 186]